MVNINLLMKQAQEMQAKVAKIQESLKTKEYEGASGGGMVKVTVNGQGEMRALKIDSSIVKQDEVELLEDLIIAAFNDAKKKMDEDTQGQMSQVMAGMPPGLKSQF